MSNPSGSPINSDDAWLSLLGKPAKQMADGMDARVAAKISGGVYKQVDVDFIRKIGLRMGQEGMSMPAEKLDKIRRLCQLWETDIKVSEIRSHRKLIGPVIVAAKKALLPILKVLLGETLRRQREFNAEVIQLLAEISSELPESADRRR